MSHSCAHCRFVPNRTTIIYLGVGLLGFCAQTGHAALLTQYSDFSLSTGASVEENETFNLLLEHGAQFSRLDPTQGTLASVTLSLTGNLTPTIEEEDDDAISFTTSTDTSLGSLSQSTSTTHKFDSDTPTSFASTDFAVNETLVFSGVELADFIGTGTLDAYTVAELIGKVAPEECGSEVFLVCDPTASLAYSGQLALQYEYLPTDPSNVSLTQSRDFSLSTSADIDETAPFEVPLEHRVQFSKLDPTEGTLSSVTVSLDGEVMATVREEGDDPITFETTTTTGLSALSESASSTNDFNATEPTRFATKNFFINEALVFSGPDLAAFIGAGAFEAFTFAELSVTLDNVDSCSGTFSLCEPIADLLYSGRITVDYDFAAADQPPAAVSEPQPLLLFGAGLAGLLCLRARARTAVR